MMKIPSDFFGPIVEKIEIFLQFAAQLELKLKLIFAAKYLAFFMCIL